MKLSLTIILFMVCACQSGPQNRGGYYRISCLGGEVYQSARTYNPKFNYCECRGRRSGACDHHKQLKIYQAERAEQLQAAQEALEDLIKNG